MIRWRLFLLAGMKTQRVAWPVMAIIWMDPVGSPQLPTASSIITSATTTTYTTVTATSAVLATNTSNKGAIIGLASALGVVSLVGLAVLFFAIWRFRRSKPNSYMDGDGIYQPHFEPKNLPAELQNTGPDPHQDIPGTRDQGHITELPGGPNPRQKSHVAMTGELLGCSMSSLPINQSAGRAQRAEALSVCSSKRLSSKEISPFSSSLLP